MGDVLCELPLGARAIKLRTVTTPWAGGERDREEEVEEAGATDPTPALDRCKLEGPAMPPGA